MKQKEAIGMVECNVKGCDERCNVYGFEPRGERGSAFKGKKYFVCPIHGRVGSDGSQVVTDYILEKADIWGAGKPKNEPASPVVGGESQPTQQPIQSSSSATLLETQSQRSQSLAKPIQPAQSKPTQTPKKATPEPIQPTEEPAPGSVWEFFKKWGTLIQ